jgi:hypothetical protein
LRSCATALVLTLILTGPASSEPSYEQLARHSDVIIVAWLEHAELEAVGDRTSWTVTYRVNEVLKGSYPENTLVLQFDASRFEHSDYAQRGEYRDHNLVILFLDRKAAGRLAYAGPPLDSLQVIASAENVTLLRSALAEPEVTFLDWLKGHMSVVVMAIALIIVLLLLVAVVVRRPRPDESSSET